MVHLDIYTVCITKRSNYTNDNLDYQIPDGVLPQNHTETEKLVVSLLMACHQPGGMNNKSPGSSLPCSAFGIAWSWKSGNSEFNGANTSTREVFIMEGLTAKESLGLDIGYGYIHSFKSGGASQTVL